MVNWLLHKPIQQWTSTHVLAKEKIVLNIPPSVVNGLYLLNIQAKQVNVATKLMHVKNL